MTGLLVIIVAYAILIAVGHFWLKVSNDALFLGTIIYWALALFSK